MGARTGCRTAALMRAQHAGNATIRRGLPRVRGMRRLWHTIQGLPELVTESLSAPQTQPDSTQLRLIPIICPDTLRVRLVRQFDLQDGLTPAAFQHVDELLLWKRIHSSVLLFIARRASGPWCIRERNRQILNFPLYLHMTPGRRQLTECICNSR